MERGQSRSRKPRIPDDSLGHAEVASPGGPRAGHTRTSAKGGAQTAPRHTAPLDDEVRLALPVESRSLRRRVRAGGYQILGVRG